MPTTGNIPMTIPILITPLIMNVQLREPHKSLLNEVGASIEISIPLRKMENNTVMSKIAPSSPNSSAFTAKMKSVVCVGKNARCACVPCSQPFPVIPPDPTAILLCIML